MKVRIKGVFCICLLILSIFASSSIPLASVYEKDNSIMTDNTIEAKTVIEDQYQSEKIEFFRE